MEVMIDVMLKYYISCIRAEYELQHVSANSLAHAANKYFLIGK